MIDISVLIMLCYTALVLGWAERQSNWRGKEYYRGPNLWLLLVA